MSARPSQHRERTQRRSIMLRPGPAGNIQSAIRIDTCLGKDRIPVDRFELSVLTQKSAEVGRDLRAPGQGCNHLAAIEVPQTETEADEIGEVAQGFPTQIPSLEQQPQ